MGVKGVGGAPSGESSSMRLDLSDCSTACSMAASRSTPRSAEEGPEMSSSRSRERRPMLGAEKGDGE